VVKAQQSKEFIL
jgi:hypothetical protein